MLPLLALLTLLVDRSDRARQNADAVAVALMFAVVIAAAAVRSHVIGGLGGYADQPWSVHRAFEAAGSYVVAAVTPPNIELLRSPWLLALPVVLLVVVAWRVVVLGRRGDTESLRLIAFGSAWFAIAILPLLNLAVDLNNANGERLMLLASVGVAVVAAGLLPRPSAGRALAGTAVLIAGLFALSFYTSFDWLAASRLSDRLIAQAAQQATGGNQLMLLSAPENYGTAHVFT